MRAFTETRYSEGSYPMSVASEAERLMLELVNAERVAVGLQPVQLALDLNASAEAHSRWMLGSGNFDHTGEGGSSAGDRMRAAGFDFEGSWSWAENIALQSLRGEPGIEDDVRNLHESLMNSPGHRANILSPDVEYIGIGIETGQFEGFEAVTVTQNFARTAADVALDTGPSGSEPPPATPEDGLVAAADPDPAPETPAAPDPVVAEPAPPAEAPPPAAGPDATPEPAPEPDPAPAPDPVVAEAPDPTEPPAPEAFVPAPEEEAGAPAPVAAAPDPEDEDCAPTFAFGGDAGGRADLAEIVAFLKSFGGGWKGTGGDVAMTDDDAEAGCMLMVRWGADPGCDPVLADAAMSGVQPDYLLI
jgi:uncharacterized protein YkwD